MERFNMFYCEFYVIILFTLLGNTQMLLSQGNCLIYPEDSGERKACELSYQAIEYKQGSKESQVLFDQAISVGPKYAYAYYQKSVPYFKRGLFAEGLSLITRAIEIEPKNYLYYRAYYYFYNRSYEYCIMDLEELYAVHKASFVTTPGGELEMRLLLALSYTQVGNVEKGIDWMLNLMERYNKQPQLKGMYDHHCLGMMYYKNNQFDLAEQEFMKQLIIDSNFADTHYYLGLISVKESEIKLAVNYFKAALGMMNGVGGGYTTNLFTEFNVRKEAVKEAIATYSI